MRIVFATMILMSIGQIAVGQTAFKRASSAQDGAMAKAVKERAIAIEAYNLGLIEVFLSDAFVTILVDRCTDANNTLQKLKKAKTISPADHKQAHGDLLAALKLAGSARLEVNRGNKKLADAKNNYKASDNQFVLTLWGKAFESALECEINSSSATKLTISANNQVEAGYLWLAKVDKILSKYK